MKKTVLVFLCFCWVLSAQNSKEGAAAPSGSFYVEPGSYGSKRADDPPSYVRPLAKRAATGNDWLYLGLDSRLREEIRYNDIRRDKSYNTDYPLLLRQRLYIKAQNFLGPLQLVFEMEDARRVGSVYPDNTSDVNTFEVIQLYAGLYFKNALKKDAFGNHRPIDIRFGRMAFDFLDRRLISLNAWRNTTNNFTGLRFSIGQDKNDWQIDGLVVKPIRREEFKPDATDSRQLFTALMPHFRKWSKIITIEPCYMGLNQSADPVNNTPSRDIHGVGIRLYNRSAKTGINYDLAAMHQFGTDNGLRKQAYALNAEMGYTFLKTASKLRLSGFFAYVSGDKNPNDKTDNRFERYFGFSRPWSSTDYISMENIITGKWRIDISPKIGNTPLKIEAGYGIYYLQSPTDRFSGLFGRYNRDPEGKSGSFVGHDFDIAARCNVFRFIALNVGYAHFMSGDFIKARQAVSGDKVSNSAGLIYFETVFNIVDMADYFGIGKKATKRAD